MNFEALTAAIDKRLGEYKVTIDGYVTNYRARKAMFERTLAENSDKWTSEYLAQYRAENAPKASDYTSKIAKEQEAARKVINPNLEEIKREIHGFFNAPINPDFAAKITAIATIGMHTSDTEFQLLKEAAGSFLELRLLQTLADKRTIESDEYKRDAEENPERKRVVTLAPLDIGYLPNPDEMNKTFIIYRNSVAEVINYYSGENAELADGLPMINGAKADGIIAISSASAYWNSNHRKTFETELAKANAILPEFKHPKKLTESQKNIIDAIIPPEDAERYPTLFPGEVREAAAKDPAIRELILADPRYSHFLEEV